MPSATRHLLKICIHITIFLNKEAMEVKRPHREDISNTSHPSNEAGLYTHFCVVNENVFELILSYLSNQARAKLQAITGDSYPDCEPRLATYCCGCQNDNPIMLGNLCRECESKCDNYSPLIHKEVATAVYGLKVRELANCHGHHRLNETLYSRVDLDNYMIRAYGSKIEWLREIARRDLVERTIESIQRRGQHERYIFMESLAPGFEVYASLVDLEETDRSILWQCSQRFLALTNALHVRRLELRMDCELCERYITAGCGDISAVVDSTEEMQFLVTSTDYSQRCRRMIEDNQRYTTVQECREQAKQELCTAYLDNHRGLKLPQRWKRCRERFEDVKRAGSNPLNEVHYIYGSR